MLPKIARASSGVSARTRWGSVVCSVAILALPTWTQQAQSQIGDKVEKKSEDKPAADPRTIGGFPPQLPTELRAASINRPSLPPMAPPSVEYFPQPVGEEKRILSVLEEQVDFDFKSETLEGVLTKIGDMHGIQFEIDQRHLQEESIKTDVAEITFKRSGISLRSALNSILRRKDLAFFIKDEVIRVTSMTDALEHRPTRTYPVRDLVGNVHVDYELLSLTIQQTLGGPPNDPWMEMDGEGGSISVLPATGSLVIRQTPKVHDEMLNLLRSLRKANAEATELKVK